MSCAKEKKKKAYEKFGKVLFRKVMGDLKKACALLGKNQGCCKLSVVRSLLLCV